MTPNSSEKALFTSHMCSNIQIFSQPNTYFLIFLSLSTDICNCIMVYASLECISVAMMSPIKSVADMKGECFRFHLKALFHKISTRPTNQSICALHIFLPTEYDFTFIFVVKGALVKNLTTYCFGPIRKLIYIYFNFLLYTLSDKSEFFKVKLGKIETSFSTNHT